MATTTTTSTSTTTTPTPVTPTPTTNNTNNNNVTPLSPEDELKAIKKQVEFYFSDSNYPRDKFLRAQAALSHEGYVPISVLLSFQRMKAYTLEKVVSALASSTLVQLNASKTGVRRFQPPAEEDTSIPRTIYVKGWPAQTTIDGVEKFYAPFGTVLSVRLRRFEDSKAFKGSLFVEFATEEEALKVYNIKPVPQALSEVNTATVAGPSNAPAPVPKTPLQYLMKSEWIQEKHEEAQKYKTHALKKRTLESEEKKNKKKQKKTGEDGKVEDGKVEVEVLERKSIYPPGMLLKFSNIPPGFTHLSLRPIFEEYGMLRFIDYKNDSTEGYARFGTPQHPLDLIKGFKEKNTLIGGQVPALRLATEEEEKDYWTELQAKLPKGKDKPRKGKGNNQKGGKGGKNHFRKGGKYENFKKGKQQGKQAQAKAPAPAQKE